MTRGVGIASEAELVIRDQFRDGDHRELAPVELHVANDEADHLRAVIVEFFSALDETTTELVAPSLMRPRLAAAERALRAEAELPIAFARLGAERQPRPGWQERVLAEVDRLPRPNLDRAPRRRWTRRARRLWRTDAVIPAVFVIALAASLVVAWLAGAL